MREHHTVQETKKGPIHRSLYANDEVSIFQRLGPQFHVNIRVLSKAGERHQYILRDANNRLKELRGTVPQGYSYIEITLEKDDLSDFWNAVKVEKQSQKQSANPPKI